MTNLFSKSNQKLSSKVSNFLSLPKTASLLSIISVFLTIFTSVQIQNCIHITWYLMWFTLTFTVTLTCEPGIWVWHVIYQLLLFVHRCAMLIYHMWLFVTLLRHFNIPVFLLECWSAVDTAHMENSPDLTLTLNIQDKGTGFCIISWYWDDLCSVISNPFSGKGR